MKVNIKELLDFFDDKKDSLKGDANALMGMIGEDLNAYTYKHYVENERKGSIEVLGDSVVQGRKGGKQLDRWMLDKKRNALFQCEIKSWAATAIGGKSLKAEADKMGIKEVAQYHWKRQLSTNLSKKHEHPNGVSKVLLTMRNPRRYSDLEVDPLLIYWMPISSDKAGLKPLSHISNFPIKTAFKKLHVFSVSLYLRGLLKKGKRIIDLEMPHFEHRMEILGKIAAIKLKTNKSKEKI